MKSKCMYVNGRKRFKYSLNILLYLLIVVVSSGFVLPEDKDCCRHNSDRGYLSIQDSRFVDGENRTVILNGINHVVKDPVKGYMHKDDKALFKQFKRWGFNVVRYGVIWDGIEPEPGVINEDYLKQIDKRVKWAEDNGLWIILDMHQDLYSRRYSDGAPLWATIDDNQPHIEGTVWSDAYLISPAIHRVFDNFWANAPAPDGVGIQDHYIQVWKVLAERYANSPAVAGFDVMNEPFMGSGAANVLKAMFEGFAMVIAQKTGKIPTVQELESMWANEEQRIEALDMINDKQVYLAVMGNAQKVVDEFEQGDLSSFYQRLRDTIRSVNKHQIIFLEHNYFCNLGIKSTFIVPKDERGHTDKLCAYAPHGYDLVTDTKGASNPGENRVEAIFDQIYLSAEERGLATLVGEWGAFYTGSNYLSPAKQLVSIFEDMLYGQTYWAWWDDIEMQDYFATLSRAYPMSTVGVLGRYTNDWVNGVFYCEWDEEELNKNDVKECRVYDNLANRYTRIYIPSKFDINSIILTPESEIDRVSKRGKGFYLDIEAIGGERTLRFEYLIE